MLPARPAGRARVRGPNFEVPETSNPELRIAPFSRFTRHGLGHWRTVSASCQKNLPLLHDLTCAIPAIAFHAVDCLGELLWLHLAGFDGYHRVAIHAFQIDRLHAGHF